MKAHARKWLKKKIQLGTVGFYFQQCIFGWRIHVQVDNGNNHPTALKSSNMKQ